MTVVELQEKYIKQITEYQALVATGELSQDEYQELVQDLIDSDKIKEKLDEEEDIIQIGNVIEVLATVAKAVS